ncbi:RagB/SusD family nutrient uptake outer membrane protein [Pedobacter sp. PLR]|uniref:RagB/SusD family nutrient uptake outer membrane protein n=1 Tax=Pedobacter sp. PLR TaxID=2994465 RepID=UPI002245EC72|nr:RagB/SusD family nutrient uptake outer membrane protein [Pedobacter sp. PLR]MCX2451097.1 RagB/SusD family nutrient uptake outer membrane protein [Pedobacter sp. PLR]
MKLNIKSSSKILLIAMVVLGTGCKKFLEEKDPSNLEPETYYTIPEHAEASIAAGYAQTRFIGNGAGIFAANFSMLELVTGTAKTETGQNSDLNNLAGLSFTGENLLIRNWWSGLYNVIAQTNLTLQKVPGIGVMDETRRKQVLGEARFLRAWAYFYLVRLYGDVPLILIPQDIKSPDFYPARTGTEAVYKQIVDDLTIAEAAGLPWQQASGTASKGAVKALLGKVYLTMAGFPLNKGAAYYKLAADKSLEVITDGGFGLFDTYAELHSLVTENRKEHMFGIQYLASVSTNPMQQLLLPNFKDVSAYSDEVGSTVPTSNFYNSYEAGDLRAKDRVGFFYTSYYTGGFGELKQLNAPYIFKHFDVIANGTLGVKGTAQSSLNWPQIRYAEVLLNYAEAQNRADGAPNQGALDAVNAIRKRALLTPLAGLGQTQFEEAVWRERWHELCYEGITWFDMVRLRKVYNESTQGFDNFVGHAFAATPNVILKDKHLLFPLPSVDYKNNPNLRPQNPGY